MDNGAINHEQLSQEMEVYLNELKNIERWIEFFLEHFFGQSAWGSLYRVILTFRGGKAKADVLLLPGGEGQGEGESPDVMALEFVA